jgi:GntR family transcriptional regulator
MFLNLNPHSGVPLYQQVVRQVRARIVGGELAAGTQLPSVREVSLQLKLNPLTVSKAYAILEGEGLIETRRGLGTYVRASSRMRSEAERRQLVQPLIDDLASQARSLGLSKKELVRALDEALARLRREEGER